MERGDEKIRVDVVAAACRKHNVELSEIEPLGDLAGLYAGLDVDGPNALFRLFFKKEADYAKKLLSNELLSTFSVP